MNYTLPVYPGNSYRYNILKKKLDCAPAIKVFKCIGPPGYIQKCFAHKCFYMYKFMYSWTLDRALSRRM